MPEIDDRAGGQTLSFEGLRVPIEVLERISDGFSAVDRHWRYLYINRKGALLLGRSQEDLVRKNIWEEFPDAIGGPFYAACHKAASERISVATESYYAPWGRWFENRIYPEEDGLTIFFNETTPTRVLAARLRDSDERLRLAVSSANVGLWDWDLTTNQVVFSAEWKRQIGYRDDEISNDFSEWQSRVHPDDLKRVLEDISSYLKNPRPHYEQEFRFRHKDGSYLWILTHAALTLDERSTPVRMTGSHIDITTRKLAERALAESEERFRATFEQAAVGIAHLSPEWRFLRANTRLCETLGYSHSEILTKSRDDVLVPLNPDPCLMQFEGIRTGESDFYRTEREMVRKDGSVFWANMTVSAVRDPSGVPAYVIVVVEDITVRKRAELQLRESEDTLQAAQKNARIGCWRFRPETGYVWSDQMYELYGHPRNPAPSFESILAVVHPEDRAAVQGSRERARQGGKPFEEEDFRTEYRVVLPDGAVRTLLSLGKLRCDGSGRPFEALGTLQDVTEQRAAQDALRQSEAKFRAAFSALVEGVVIMDDRGKVTDINRAVEELLGFSREVLADPSGEPRPRIIREDGSPFPIDDMPARIALRTGQPSRDVVMGIPRANGGLVWVCVNAQPMRDEYGKVHGVVSSLFDITERRNVEAAIHRVNAELEHRVEERTKQLQEINRELETFTYSVSHDLKAPLRGLDGYSRLLADNCTDQLSEDGRHFVRSIRLAAEQMNQLIDDLLSYSRLERCELAMTTLNLRTLASQVVESRAVEIARRNVRLTVTLPNLKVRADRQGVLMALRNVLDNALKFSSGVQHPIIEIGGQDSGPSVTVFVKDNGVGFDMKYHDRIFEIFQRLNRAELYPGTGVGLALVRKAMNRIGGRVWAESKPSEGATFYFEMPK